MAIRGRLEHLKLFMVFRSIIERRMSGVLTLQSVAAADATPIIKRAEIAHGYPVRTASNQRRDGLVHALVDEGLISSTEEVDLRNRATETQTPIDVMVLQMGLVAPRRLTSLQERVARQILLEPFSWTDGLYQFEEGVVRPNPGAQGIDLVDVLVEAAARTLTADAALQFVARYAHQTLWPTELAAHHALRFDTFFPAPNTRSMLEAATPFELIARVRGDRLQAAREVAVMVLAGMARYQAENPAIAAAAQAPATSGGIRRATAPANLAGRDAAPSAEGRPAVTIMRSKPSAPPESAGPPPPLRRGPEVTPPRRTADVAPPPVAVPLTPAAGGPPPPPRRAPGPGTPASGMDKSAAKPPPDERTMSRIRTARERLARLDGQSHYEVLGVTSSASPDGIRNAFRALARDFHPDQFVRFALEPADAAAVQRVFMAINRAQETLADPAARQEHDAEIALRATGQHVSSDGAGADVSRVFRAEKLIKEGLNLVRNGSNEVAKERFDEALSAVPDDPLARAGATYAGLMVALVGGASRTAMARAAEVLTDVTEGMGSEGGREEPFLYLGRVLRMLDQPERASAAFFRALKINPHCTEAASELRNMQRKQHEEKKGGLFGLRKKG